MNIINVPTIILNFEVCYIVEIIEKNPKFFGIVATRNIAKKIKDLAKCHPDKEVAANEYFRQCLLDKWVENSINGMKINIMEYTEKDMELDLSYFNSWGYAELLNTLRK